MLNKIQASYRKHHQALLFVIRTAGTVTYVTQNRKLLLKNSYPVCYGFSKFSSYNIYLTDTNSYVFVTFKPDEKFWLLKDTTTLDERELLENVALGNLHAFELLYHRFMPKLYRFIYPFTNQSKEDTEEIIQDVLIKVWIKKEQLVMVRSLEAFLMRMAKNQLIDQRRSIQSRQMIAHKVSLSAITETKSVHDELVYNEYYQTALQALENLSPQRRRIFEMRTQQEMSIDEIAAALHITRSAVKKQLYEAVNHIKQYLSDEMGWPLLLSLLLILS